VDIELHRTNTMVVVGVVVWWFFCSFSLPCMAFCNVLITICVHLYRFSTSCTLFSTEIVNKVHICSTDVDLCVIFHQNRMAVHCRISYVISVFCTVLDMAAYSVHVAGEAIQPQLPSE
jgi:hypothetical protein